ncbi:MAG: Hsp20/alpha crystallin family protein [Patescibacteria group bacterium]
MDNSEEKFFEELANQRAKTEKEYEVGLVKASSVVEKRTEIEAEPKKIIDENMDEVEGQLTIDVYQTPSEIIVESAIAGVKPEDIDISVSADSITIKGARHRENEINKNDFFYQECYWGRFSRSIILPQEIDPEGATVSLKNGILTVRLPKLNRKRIKKLKVKAE